uniref:Uncharacterized protein n=1 Tax=Enterococcus faecium TaxID=1352 RepID=A0A7T8KSM7_ENTFC|nr:hypothetical protein [Enterococcus faecium]
MLNFKRAKIKMSWYLILVDFVDCQIAFLTTEVPLNKIGSLI